MIADDGHEDRGRVPEEIRVLPVVVIEGGKLRGIACQVPLGVLTVDAMVTESMGPESPPGFEVVWPKAEEMLQRIRAEIRERPRIAIATGPLPPAPEFHKKHR